MTVAGLVCEALSQAGASVDNRPVPPSAAAGAQAAYRVELRPLGQNVILVVTLEAPLGAAQESRSLRLSRLEEVPVAAPRIAEALVSGKPVSQTAKVDTLVGEDSRPLVKKHGELKAGIGVLGFGIPSSDVLGGYGVLGQLFYEERDYAVGAQVRFGGSSSSSGDATLDDITLGARYFFSDADITPVLGAGVGILWLDFRGDKIPSSAAGLGTTYGTPYYSRKHFDGAGLAAHVEAGVEFMRMHDVRFDVLLRLDAPLYQLHDSQTGDDRYALPISLMASYSFE